MAILDLTMFLTLPYCCVVFQHEGVNWMGVVTGLCKSFGLAVIEGLCGQVSLRY